MKLIIIGNGFDLAHGLPTSFNDFRNHLSKNIENVEFVNKINDILKTHGMKIDEKYDWNEIEKVLFLEENRIIENKLPQKLQELEEIIEEFEERIDNYLTEIVNPKISRIDLLDSIKKELTQDSIIYNFNYTNLYKKYLNINKGINIHGNIDDKQSNLIVGYYKDDPLIRALNISTNYESLFKRGVVSKTKQAYKYNGIDLTNQINQKSPLEEITEIIVIGFSFGESDEHIYKIIYNHIYKQYSSKIVQSGEYNKKGDIKIKIFDFNNDSEEKYNRIISKLKEEKIITEIVVTGLTENDKKSYRRTSKNVFPFIRCEYNIANKLNNSEDKNVN